MWILEGHFSSAWRLYCSMLHPARQLPGEVRIVTTVSQMKKLRPDQLPSDTCRTCTQTQSHATLEKAGSVLVPKFAAPLRLCKPHSQPKRGNLKKGKKENSNCLCVFTTRGPLLGGEYEILIFQAGRQQNFLSRHEEMWRRSIISNTPANAAQLLPVPLDEGVSFTVHL